MWILTGLFVMIGIIMSYIRISPCLEVVATGTIPNLTGKKLGNLEFVWYEPYGVTVLDT
jgi:hypothetical protein